MVVETYSHVLHIVSQVSGHAARGRRRDGRAALGAAGRHALRRAEGPGDADHRRARAGQALLLRRRDRLPRPANGDLDTAIHIRTVVVKDGQVHVQAGGGTVADAKPAYEYHESVNKAKAVFRAVELAVRAAGLGLRPMKVLVIDNYDSFTYNLVQYLGELGAELEVVRNDKATVDELLERDADRLVVSPGPCTPAEAGISVEAIAPLRRSRARPRSASASATSRWSRPSAARSSGRADPRQGRRDRARRHDDLRRPAEPAASPAATTR